MLTSAPTLPEAAACPRSSLLCETYWENTAVKYGSLPPTFELIHPCACLHTFHYLPDSAKHSPTKSGWTRGWAQSRPPPRAQTHTHAPSVLLVFVLELRWLFPLFYFPNHAPILDPTGILGVAQMNRLRHHFRRSVALNFSASLFPYQRRKPPSVLPKNITQHTPFL